MIYRINKTNYCDFNTFEVNKLPPRSYFIPYPDRASADAVSGRERRYSSPKVICLNGDWDFRFYPRPSEIPGVIDTDGMDFGSIDVPSCWQFRGYDRPFYVNLRYQFPYDPPRIPKTERAGKVFSLHGADYGLGPRWKDPGEEYNFAGLYRTFFDTQCGDIDCGTKRHIPDTQCGNADDDPKRYILSFLGVASCADVYVNGEFAGYTEGSHNTAEFDVTPLLREGRNELVVLVRRWCNGTYLEDQDMFRNNGIFRDVLLRIEEDGDFRDVDFVARKAGRAYYATARAELHGDAEVTFTLTGPGVHETKTVKSREGRAEVTFRNIGAAEWSAETPVLYDLYFETESSCVKTRVGFRDVKIRGDVFLLNGRRVKLHGVNHHDTSCTNGYTMTPEEIERDMRLCREFNIDTVRTSHYPPDPYLLELCDELGLYVVDEADLETHGTFVHRLPPSYNRISNDPKWEAHYVDRAARMYQRDKMHPSIIMWSLGNEAGGTYNTDRMYDYIKRFSDLPIHYESAVHTKKKAYDVASEMYPPSERVHEIGDKTYKIKQFCDRPYFMCEYAHAMGVGPGGMEDYWKEIYSHDSLMGGCVWEMVDHAVLHEDGSYTYGGDHGEWEHDRNFCVDGMFYPDRSPSTGAFITKFVYRPIRIRYLGGDEFELFNTRSFTQGTAWEMRYRWSDGSGAIATGADGSAETGTAGAAQIAGSGKNGAAGTVTASGSDSGAVDVRCEPLSVQRVRIETGSHIRAAKAAGTDCLLTVTTVEKKTGREVSREQITIREYVPGRPSYTGIVPLPEEFIDEEAERISFRLSGVSLAPADPYTILFRAATDNDYIFWGVKENMSDFACQRTDDLSIERTCGKLIITSRITCKKNVFECIDTYEAIGSPAADTANDPATEDPAVTRILVTSKLRCIKGKGDLPRFGKAFRFDSSYDAVTYYGRCGESYADMKDQYPIERVSCKVADMTEPNIKPQESGSRFDTRWASVSDGSRTVTFTAVDRPFELGIKPYSDRELLGMKHRGDEVRTGTYVTVSAFQQGIGTGICGPQTKDEFKHSVRKEYELRFVISVDGEER